MKTDLDFRNKDLFGPVVFRPGFNSQAESITATQAWSLFFTAGQEDKALGFTSETGRFFTNLLLAVGAAGILGVTLFNSIG
jgi:hypothetical protein